ncbi:hypothetical protein J6590_073079, partial [Homalodisca vitripennis]
MQNLKREQLLRSGSRLQKHNNCVSAESNYDCNNGFMELRDLFVTKQFLKSFAIEPPWRLSTLICNTPLEPRRKLKSHARKLNPCYRKLFRDYVTLGAP